MHLAFNKLKIWPAKTSSNQILALWTFLFLNLAHLPKRLPTPAINGSCWCYNAKVQLQHSYISTFGFNWRMFYKLCLSCKLMKPCILWLILSQGEILQWMNSSFIVVYSTLFEIVLYLIEKMFQAILLFITFETTVTYLYLDWKG